jgi:hypothetical protein
LKVGIPTINIPDFRYSAFAMSTQPIDSEELTSRVLCSLYTHDIKIEKKKVITWREVCN